MVRFSLRRKVFLTVTCLVIFSMAASLFSLYRITKVGKVLFQINRQYVPLNRLLLRIQTDAEILDRELQKGIAFSNWNTSQWKPKQIPIWLREVLDSETQRLLELTQKYSNDGSWFEWSKQFAKNYDDLKIKTNQLYFLLEQKNKKEAIAAYPQWSNLLSDWLSQLELGVKNSQKEVQQGFSFADAQVEDLRTILQIVLILVICLSLLFMWLGERALRPLSDLIGLVKKIATYGLEKSDKSKLPEISLTRKDEVSELAREFHQMATVLLEREKIVDAQKDRLEHQNQLLKELSSFNENILNSITSLLFVVDQNNRVSHVNDCGFKWIQLPPEKVIGLSILDIEILKPLRKFLENHSNSFPIKIDECEMNNKIFAGHIVPLKIKDSFKGMIVVLEDQTEERAMEKKLRLAEKLAAIGAMSAQIAHEVRNPLNSISLETEMALDLAEKDKTSLTLKNSLQTILLSVDRLEKVTEKYLELSRSSALDQKEPVDLSEVLDEVLTTYGTLCESQKIKVEWKRKQGESYHVIGDRLLYGQVLGNLFKNSIQAFEELNDKNKQTHEPKIFIELIKENKKILLRIKDNGCGIAIKFHQKIFEPFMTTKARGTGLGLPFVKRVIEAYHGKIQLEQLDAENKGTSFLMEFKEANLEFIEKREVYEKENSAC